MKYLSAGVCYSTLALTSVPATANRDESSLSQFSFYG